MSDMQSMGGENKKRQLRQNIVQMPDAGSDEPMDDERLARYKKRIIAVAAACFLAALGFTGYRYMNEYTSYSVQWSAPCGILIRPTRIKNTGAGNSAAADEEQMGPMRPLRQKALPVRTPEIRLCGNFRGRSLKDSQRQQFYPICRVRRQYDQVHKRRCFLH